MSRGCTSHKNLVDLYDISIQSDFLFHIFVVKVCKLNLITESVMGFPSLGNHKHVTLNVRKCVPKITTLRGNIILVR